jgi:ribosomal protein S18 acetylase RimI-like enzyme
MTFRPATKADAPALAELVNYAGEGMPLYLWTKLARDGEDPWNVGRARASREEGAFSYRNATVIEQDGECAGCLIGYEIPDVPQPVSPDMPPMFVPFQELENLAPSTWYINVLAVQPKFRNRGLGVKLIELAEDTGRKAGKRGMSLIVADKNFGAQRLYLRQGYTRRALRKMVIEDWNTENEAGLLLVKDF